MSAEINKPGTRGLAHILKAAGYSMKGLKAAITHEEAFRLELMAMVVMLPLAVCWARVRSNGTAYRQPVTGAGGGTHQFRRLRRWSTGSASSTMNSRVVQRISALLRYSSAW